MIPKETQGNEWQVTAVATCGWFHPDILAGPAEGFIRYSTLYLIRNGAWPSPPSLFDMRIREVRELLLFGLLSEEGKIWLHRSSSAGTLLSKPIVFSSLTNWQSFVHYALLWQWEAAVIQ